MRQSLLTPPAEMEQAASLLDEAANAILSEQMQTAADLLRKADMPVLHAYASRMMSPSAELLGFDRRTRRARPEALVRSAGLRMPTGTAAEAILRRDGFRCRYCGCRVVRPGARSLLTGLFPDIVRWPRGKGGDKGKHAAFFALNAALDHVEPYARGGDSSADNIVTACWPCNFGKEDHTLEELALSDPRLRQPTVDQWDGLERLVRNRRKPAKPPTEPQTFPAETPPESVDAWLDITASVTTQGVIDGFRDLLAALQATPNLRLSVGRNLIVNVILDGRRLGILGVSTGADVDVPWLIDGRKDWFKPFAEGLAEAVPGAILYETPRMWRVDGCGTARGQITLDELVGASSVVLDGVRRLAQG